MGTVKCPIQTLLARNKGSSDQDIAFKSINVKMSMLLAIEDARRNQESYKIQTLLKYLGDHYLRNNFPFS